MACGQNHDCENRWIARNLDTFLYMSMHFYTFLYIPIHV